jgi:hypothetical protein
MDLKEKELLFKDLCARLPYHVRCKIWLKDGTTEEGLLDLEHNYGNVLQDAFYYNKIKDIKPYLRPMSSMTEEEENEIRKINCQFKNDLLYSGVFSADDGGCTVIEMAEILNFLNAHHFDYRGLIEKGLVLKAPQGMYN